MSCPRRLAKLRKEKHKFGPRMSPIINDGLVFLRNRYLTHPIKALLSCARVKKQLGNAGHGSALRPVKSSPRARARSHTHTQTQTYLPRFFSCLSLRNHKLSPAHAVVR